MLNIPMGGSGDVLIPGDDERVIELGLPRADAELTMSPEPGTEEHSLVFTPATPGGRMGTITLAYREP